MAMSFGGTEDATVLAGQTNGTDLVDQLRLLAAKLAYPRWDESLFRRYQASGLESYELHFASASARAKREFPLFRSEEHTSELQSLMRISYAVFCLKKKKK